MPENLDPIVVGPSVTSEIQTIKIFLVNSEKEAEACTFWAGVYRSGSKSPQELINLTKANDILAAAVNEGVSSSEPFVITDTEDGGNSAFFLAPVQNEQITHKLLWQGELCNVISQWAPQAPGLYLSPDLLGAEISSKLLLQILKKLILKNQFTTFYLLIGTHGLHSILNTALALRNQMEMESKDVLIYH